MVLIFGPALTAAAQNCSEYSCRSDSWHRHNRDAIRQPWKYDRGGPNRRETYASSPAWVIEMELETAK